MVDPAEVRYNDGYRKGDNQHATERADRAEDLSGDGVWNHVSIPATNTNVSQALNSSVCLCVKENDNLSEYDYADLMTSDCLVSILQSHLMQLCKLVWKSACVFQFTRL